MGGGFDGGLEVGRGTRVAVLLGVSGGLLGTLITSPGWIVFEVRQFSALNIAAVVP